jgi:hypothetical protein
MIYLTTFHQLSGRFHTLHCCHALLARCIVLVKISEKGVETVNLLCYFEKTDVRCALEIDLNLSSGTFLAREMPAIEMIKQQIGEAPTLQITLLEIAQKAWLT